jgi:hypothetical protein
MTHLARDRVAGRRPPAIVVVLLTLATAACTAAPEPTGTPVNTSTSPADASLESTPATSGPERGTATPESTQESAPGTTPVRVIFDEIVLEATLWDNPAAQSLVEQLPLTVPFEDYGQQEKVGTPPRPLSMDGMPAGDDPEPLDIGYYAPSGVLVLYYADVGYFTGIARLGHFDSPIDDLVDLPDGTTITIELAP